MVYLGEPPSKKEERAFTDRGYEVEGYTEAMLSNPSDLVAVDSVIFTQNAHKPTEIFTQLKRCAETLLNFDCRIYVRVAESESLQKQARAIVVNAVNELKLPAAGLFPSEREAVAADVKEREGNPLAPFVYVCDSSVGWPDIARLIGDNPSGKPPNQDLKIDAINSEGQKITLTEENELLVRRAFWDCAEIHLRGMEDGLSGVSVFRAYAELEKGLLGRWPYLYFLKIGSRQKVATEYEKYEGSALEYIPFYLGPSLRAERCGLGARQGIIVGDWVEGAEPLRDCARDGRAVPAIGNLFGRTLWSWRNLAKPDELSIPDYLENLFPTKIPSEREALIRELGATLSVSEMKDLFMRRNSKPVLAGPVHGDLHATNVLVRSGDAIVIDFEKVESRWPLVYDAAALEGGLLVDGFADDSRSPADILSSIISLYENGVILERISSCHPKDASTWFYDCVHQIRIQARQLEFHPGQYATALALALIKKACNPHKFDDTKIRLRAVAYVLAEKILTARSRSSEEQADDTEL